jgi:hypothetical protein
MDVVRRAFCVWFLLHVWSGHSGVLGGVVAGINSTKKNYFSGDGWILVDAGDNKPITSLEDLTDGVFSLEMSAAGSYCGTGTATSS